MISAGKITEIPCTRDDSLLDRNFGTLTPFIYLEIMWTYLCMRADVDLVVI
jgi:hypothetical protein